MNLHIPGWYSSLPILPQGRQYCDVEMTPKLALDSPTYHNRARQREQNLELIPIRNDVHELISATIVNHQKRKSRVTVEHLHTAESISELIPKNSIIILKEFLDSFKN